MRQNALRTLQAPAPEQGEPKTDLLTFLCDLRHDRTRTIGWVFDSPVSPRVLSVEP